MFWTIRFPVLVIIMQHAALCNPPSISRTLNSDRKTSAKFCDVTLIVNEHKYLAHKCILRSKSRFFEKIFCVETKKHCTDEIVVKRVSKEAFETVLDFIYTGDVIMSYEITIQFIAAAYYLGISYYLRPRPDLDLWTIERLKAMFLTTLFA